MLIDARLKQLDGDFEGAFDGYIDVMANASQIEQGTTLVEGLVGVAVRALGVESALDAMAEIDDLEIDYAVLCESMEERLSPPRPIEEILQYERVMMLDVAQRGYTWDPKTNSYHVNEQGVDETGQSHLKAGFGR